MSAPASRRWPDWACGLPEALQLTLAFALAAGVAVLATPVAIHVAARTGFLDQPLGYKRHVRATPYLGGAAVMAAVVPLALLLGGSGASLALIVAGALVMWIIGTIDDRVLLSPWPRLGVEAGLGATLWVAGLGWSAFNSDVASLALTIVWIVGLVNAFNLMDNLDGAAGTVGAVCAAGVSAAVLSQGSLTFALAAIVLSGACAGFLVWNLQRPARIFLGDGGSMPIGFLVAAVLMAVSRDENGLGAAAVVAAAPVLGLPILDTTLVMVSRTRRGVRLLSGGRDHLTHRLLGVVGTPQRVAIALAGLQAALCGLGIVLLHAGTVPVLAAGIAYIVSGATAIVWLDRHRALQPEWHHAPRLGAEPVPGSAEPAIATSVAGQETTP